MIRCFSKHALQLLFIKTYYYSYDRSQSSILFTVRISFLFRHTAPTPAVDLIVINCPIGSRNDLLAPLA